VSGRGRLNQSLTSLRHRWALTGRRSKFRAPSQLGTAGRPQLQVEESLERAGRLGLAVSMKFKAMRVRAFSLPVGWARGTGGPGPGHCTQSVTQAGTLPTGSGGAERLSLRQCGRRRAHMLCGVGHCMPDAAQGARAPALPRHLMPVGIRL
jgi:hypothetical protein